MQETSKCFNLRKERNDFALFLNGYGIDIGYGNDPLKIEDGKVDLWDQKNGDATYMDGIKDNTYDFVYSSCCLEHISDIEMALYNWVRILKNEGFLYLVLPEYILYERMKWPSAYNKYHMVSFSIFIDRKKVKREDHYHIVHS